MVLEKCLISSALSFFGWFSFFFIVFDKKAIENTIVENIKRNKWTSNSLEQLWYLKTINDKNNNMKNNENEEQKFISRNLLFKNDPETAKYKKNSPKHPKKKWQAFLLQKGQNNKCFRVLAM